MTKHPIQKALLEEKFRERDTVLHESESCIKKRLLDLRRLIDYMDKMSIVQYTPSVGSDYLRMLFSDESTKNHLKKTMSLIIAIANDIFEDLPPIAIHNKVVEHKMFGSMSTIAEEYIRGLSEIKRLSSITIRRHRYILSRFTQKMSIDGITWKTLKLDNILNFFSSITNISAQHYACIKGLIHFAYEHKIIEKDFSIWLKSVIPHRKEKLPSCYSPEEILQVENSVDRSSSVGKRDYAIILLGSRLGLRSSDIRTLQFRNLDWDSNEIRLTQYKTGQSLRLPLLSEVGDAIIDYITNGRPSSNSKTIFLSHVAPFEPCHTSTISNIVRKYYLKSGVDCKGKHIGAHSLRHSMATAMLNEGTSLPIISSILGHESSDSTMYYLGVDISSLLKCSLNVPPVDENFYKQKGGMLYE